MAIVCAFAVANLYYNQPILAEIAKSFHVSAAEVGWIPTLTQLGYASGLLLFVPLGDRVEQRRLIIIMLLVTAVNLFAAALSPNLNMLILASFAIGATTIVAQLLIPFATTDAFIHQFSNTIISGKLRQGVKLHENGSNYALEI